MNDRGNRSTAARSPRKRRKIQTVTMVDVAAHAGVSPSTVSLYLRRPELVSKKTAQKIQYSVQQLDYVANMIAGGLAAASSRVVGVLVPSIQNAFFAKTVSALQRGLADANLQIILGDTGYSDKTQEALVRATLSWAPAAVVITGLHHSATTKKLLMAANIPVVQIWELGDTKPIDMSVGFHHEKAGQTAAEHLISRQYDTLIFLSGHIHQDKRALQRASGFLETAKASGIPVRHVTHPGVATTELGGVLLAMAIADGKEGQRIGIGCSNDSLALGVLFEAQRRHMQIPQDFGVIGFGDLPFSKCCNPALSTIRPAGDLIGSETARLILKRMASRACDRHDIINTGFSLIHRQST